jgi:hypothetical protein
MGLQQLLGMAAMEREQQREGVERREKERAWAWEELDSPLPQTQSA